MLFPKHFSFCFYVYERYSVIEWVTRQCISSFCIKGLHENNSIIAVQNVNKSTWPHETSRLTNDVNKTTCEYKHIYSIAEPIWARIASAMGEKPSWPGLVYEVSLGTVQGGANILTKKLTANTSTQLRLSLSRDRDVVTIVAIDKCGNTATLEDHFVVSL